MPGVHRGEGVTVGLVRADGDVSRAHEIAALAERRTEEEA
jgi:hypothetical protein